jgi:hypothetical protein
MLTPVLGVKFIHGAMPVWVPILACPLKRRAVPTPVYPDLPQMKGVPQCFQFSLLKGDRHF